MKKYCARFLLILSFIIISCVSENSNDGTAVELYSPEFDRQVVNFSDVQWHAQIQLNMGPVQNFYFNNSAALLSVNIDGVRRGDENEIIIKWFEILHGHMVEISVQRQTFFADGATTIDTAHSYTQFDYDGDGMSNLDERIVGTCVWSDTENCVNPGQTDIPTDNAVLNGDFSDPDLYWYTDLTRVLENSGEYCVISPTTAVDRWAARIFYLPVWLFIDANTSYNLEFDVRAQSSSQVFARIQARTGDTYEELEDMPVAVSTTYETKSIRYESADVTYSEASIDFSFGNGTENTYCFDNVKLIRESSN